MKKLELTSELLPIVSVGTYDGQYCDPEFILNEDEYNENYDKFNFEKYKNALVNMAKKFIESEVMPDLKKLNIGIEKIEVIKIVSPRFYNFESDRLYFDLYIKDIELFEDKLGSFDKSFDSFIEENYKSYDGFTSFMPQTRNEISIALDSDPERATSQIICFLLKDKFVDYRNNFRENVMESINEYDIYD